jgi:archaellum component FlaC
LNSLPEKLEDYKKEIDEMLSELDKIKDNFKRIK